MSRTTSNATAMAEHPLVRALGCIAGDLDDVADLDPTFLPTGDKARVLVAIQRQLSRLEGLRLQVLAVSGDVAADRGARSAGVWLAGETRTGPRVGVRDQRVADRLARWPEVVTALRAGQINAAQAEVVVGALEALPAGLDDELTAKATGRLLADAGHFEPRQLGSWDGGCWR